MKPGIAKQRFLPRRFVVGNQLTPVSPAGCNL